MPMLKMNSRAYRSSSAKAKENLTHYDLNDLMAVRSRLKNITFCNEKFKFFGALLQ